MDKSALRDAATIVLHREGRAGPEVLMGQRGAKAAFMPNKFVFPGGAIDPGDVGIAMAAPPSPNCITRLKQSSTNDVTHSAPIAAIRELWEETGLILGEQASWSDPPDDWLNFANAGFRPDARALEFVFRAVMPPGRPRRFDARFFLTDAVALRGDPDDFSNASDELSHLQWIPLTETRNFDLPFITQIVLREVSAVLEVGAIHSVPFVQNDDPVSSITRLR